MKKLGIGLQVFMCALWRVDLDGRKNGVKKNETGWYGTVWLNGYAYGISRRL